MRLDQFAMAIRGMTAANVVFATRAHHPNGSGRSPISCPWVRVVAADTRVAIVANNNGSHSSDGSCRQSPLPIDIVGEACGRYPQLHLRKRKAATLRTNLSPNSGRWGVA